MDTVSKLSSLRIYIASVSSVFFFLIMLPVYSGADTGTGQVTVTSYMTDLGSSSDYTFTVPVPDTLDCSEAADPVECEMQLHPVEAPVDSEVNSAYTEAIAGMTRVVDGLAGPISLGVKYDNDLSWIGNLGYTKMFNKWFGLSAKLAGGENEYRANITAGFAIYSHNQIKITYEYLNQNLPFDFETGEVNERVGQNAVGAAYSYVWPNSVLNAIEISGNWAEANNKSLDPIVFYQNNVPFDDFRNIAGGEEENGLASLKFVPYCRTLLSLGAGYSHVQYDTEFEDEQPENSTLAYNAELSFLPTFTTKLSADVNNTASSREADAKISQIIPGHHVELAVWGLYQHGNDELPDSRSIMFGVNYPVPRAYAFEGVDQLTRMYDWVNKPVIYYQRVLAIADEDVEQFAIDANSLPSQTVAPGQFITPVSTDQAFDFSTRLFSEVDYSLKVTKSGSSGDFTNTLNLQIVQNSNFSATVSSASAIPDDEDGVYTVTIKAKGQNSGLKSPIVQTASFTLTVSDGAVWVTKTLPAATLGEPYSCVNITDFAHVPGVNNASIVYALVSSQPWLQVSTQCLQTSASKHLKQSSGIQYFLVAAGVNQDTPVPVGADPAVVLSATTVINGATLATNQNFTVTINQIAPEWEDDIDFGTVSVVSGLHQPLPIGDTTSEQSLSNYIVQGNTNLSFALDPNAADGTNYVPANWAIFQSGGQFFLERVSSSTADVGAVTVPVIATNSTSTSSVSSVPEGISLTVSAT